MPRFDDFFTRRERSRRARGRRERRRRSRDDAGDICPADPALDSAFEGMPFDERRCRLRQAPLAAGDSSRRGAARRADDVPPTRRAGRRRRKNRTQRLAHVAHRPARHRLLPRRGNGRRRLPLAPALQPQRHATARRLQRQLPGAPRRAARPKVVTDATNMLLVGSDSRAGQQTTGTGGNSRRESDRSAHRHDDAGAHRRGQERGLGRLDPA